MNFFKRFFQKSAQSLALPQNNQGDKVEAGRFQAIASKPEGQFTMYVSDRMVEFLKKNLDIELKDVAPYPQRVFDQCCQLGFKPRNPIYFLLDLQESAAPDGRDMLIAKIVPPIFRHGKEIHRSVVLYARNVLNEIEGRKQDLLDAAGQRGVDPLMKKEMLKSIPDVLRAKILTGIAHELVHIFATDEFDPENKLLEHLGLDLLELFTDSIAVSTFYEDYRKKNLFVKIGFADGAGYLMNLLGKELGESPTLAIEVVQRAKKIIRECQEKCKSLPSMGPLQQG